MQEGDPGQVDRAEPRLLLEGHAGTNRKTTENQNGDKCDWAVTDQGGEGRRQCALPTGRGHTRNKEGLKRPGLDRRRESEAPTEEEILQHAVATSKLRFPGGLTLAFSGPAAHATGSRHAARLKNTITENQVAAGSAATPC